MVYNIVDYLRARFYRNPIALRFVRMLYVDCSSVTLSVMYFYGHTWMNTLSLLSTALEEEDEFIWLHI